MESIKEIVNSELATIKASKNDENHKNILQPKPNEFPLSNKRNDIKDNAKPEENGVNSTNVRSESFNKEDSMNNSITSAHYK